MQYPSIDPVALSLGPLQIHWYGLMYVFAFAAGWLLGRWRASRPWSGWSAAQVDDYLTFVMLGVILGGRLGYVLFYDLSAYLADPLEIVRLWNGGMSFHGGLVGVVLASWLWGRLNGKGLDGLNTGHSFYQRMPKQDTVHFFPFLCLAFFPLRCRWPFLALKIIQIHNLRRHQITGNQGVFRKMNRQAKFFKPLQYAMKFFRTPIALMLVGLDTDYINRHSCHQCLVN